VIPEFHQHSIPTESCDQFLESIPRYPGSVLHQCGGDYPSTASGQDPHIACETLYQVRQRKYRRTFGSSQMAEAEGCGQPGVALRAVSDHHHTVCTYRDLGPKSHRQTSSASGARPTHHSVHTVTIS
jgi:hypothetical protein